MNENSAEAMGLAAFVAMSHLLQHLELKQPGLKQAVIDSAISGYDNPKLGNAPAVIVNLKRL